MVLKSDFYERYCRVCGSNDGICISLFCDEGKRYLSKIEKLLNIKVEVTDKLPKNICHMCISFISDYDKFRKHCGIVQVKLNNLANNLTQTKEAVPESAIDDSVKICRIEDTHTIDEKRINVNEDIGKADLIVNLDDDSPEPVDNKEEAPLKSEFNAKNWIIQTIPGRNTVLYICQNKNCSEMLLSESAAISHQCESSSVTAPSPTDTIKKRKRVIFGDANEKT